MTRGELTKRIYETLMQHADNWTDFEDFAEHPAWTLLIAETLADELVGEV